MEVLGYLILGMIDATCKLLEGKSFRSREGGSGGREWPWIVKWFVGLVVMVALVMLIFVIAHFILGPDAQGNSRVF